MVTGPVGQAAEHAGVPVTCRHGVASHLGEGYEGMALEQAAAVPKHHLEDPRLPLAPKRHLERHSGLVGRGPVPALDGLDAFRGVTDKFDRVVTVAAYGHLDRDLLTLENWVALGRSATRAVRGRGPRPVHSRTRAGAATATSSGRLVATARPRPTRARLNRRRACRETVQLRSRSTETGAAGN